MGFKQGKIEKRARLKAKELLAAHRAEPISPEVNVEIDNILKRAQDHYLQQKS